MNTLLYEMNLAQKQQNLKNEGEITKGEQWASATAGSVFEGLQDWDTGVKIAMHKFFGQDVPEYLLTDSVIATDNQRRLEDAGWGMKLLSNVSKATGNMLPTMTISMVFPQAEIKALGKFAKLIKKTATSTSMFTSSFGNGYKQAINEGRPEDEAVSYALLNAASETAMEQLIGIVGGNKGIKWLGNKAAGNKVAKNLITHIDDVVSAIAKNPAVKKKLYDYASAFGGEFMEEYLQEVMQPVFENIAYSGDEYTFKKNPVKVFSKEAFYNGIVGGIMGDVFESVGMVPKDSTVDTDTDIQTKTDTNTDPSAKVKSKSDGKLSNTFDSVTRKTLEQLSEADAMAADEAVTDAYAEHLKSEGVSSDMAETFKQESAKSRTSKASAVEHAVKVMSEYGNAIKAKVEKIAGSGKTQSADTDIANSDQVSTTLSEKLPTAQAKTLDTMTDIEVDTLYKTTINQYAETLKSDGFSETQIDSYLDEAMKTTGVENQKSAIVKLQEEMGNGQEMASEIDETNVFENEEANGKISTTDKIADNHNAIFIANNKNDALQRIDILPSIIQPKAKSFFKGSSNKYTDFTVNIMQDGTYLVAMTKPGDVIGSKAIYFKLIAPDGNTVRVYKETYDPSGNLVHTKEK